MGPDYHPFAAQISQCSNKRRKICQDKYSMARKYAKGPIPMLQHEAGNAGDDNGALSEEEHQIC